MTSQKVHNADATRVGDAPQRYRVDLQGVAQSAEPDQIDLGRPPVAGDDPREKGPALVPVLGSDEREHGRLEHILELRRP